MRIWFSDYVAVAVTLCCLVAFIWDFIGDFEESIVTDNNMKMSNSVTKFDCKYFFGFGQVVAAALRSPRLALF